MGYVGDVGASSSNSNALSTTQSAGTVFNFDSAGASGDTYATETGAESSASASASKGGSLADLSPLQIGLIVGGIVLLAGATYYITKKK